MLRPADGGLADTGAQPGACRRLAALANRVAMALGMAALVVAALVLTSSVFLRYFAHQPTDWQDETAVFLLVGATFLSAGGVQQARGHIGIEALTGSLGVRADALRRLLVDATCTAFCGFFCWQCVALFGEAWTEGQTTSSAWAPPLAIPYGLMAAGMLLLLLTLVLQVIDGLRGLVRR